MTGIVRGVSASASLAALLFLCACGGSGGGGSSSGGGGGGGGGGGVFTPPAPAPPPAPIILLSDADATRFLTQGTFGVTEADLAVLKPQGYSVWITDQMAQPPSASHQAYVDDRLIQLRVANPAVNLSPNQFYESFWQQATVGPDQLRQRVKLALSEIFVISLADPNVDARGAASYYDMLGANAFGNFRDLLQNVTLHPMMGVYLTSIANQKEDAVTGRHPDENYAREVMQLMSLGLYRLNTDGTYQLDGSGAPIPTYTADDISNLAKVFTGMSWYSAAPTNVTFYGANRNVDASVKPMIFYAAYHSTSAKTFLGVTIPATTTPDPAGDLRIALDTIYQHPNVGPFMARRLIQHLVTSNPSAAYTGRVAQVFNNNGAGVRGDMAAVVRAVLTDPEARDVSTAASFGKVREPVVRMANWMRTFSAGSVSGNYLMTSTSANTSLGQSALASPSVFNFFRPGYVPPNTRLGVQNLSAPELQIVDEITVAGYLNTLFNAVNSGAGTGADIRSAYGAEVAVATDASALVERMNRLLLYGQMSATLRSRITEAVNGVAIPSSASTTQAQIDAALLNRAKLAVFLTMASPDYLVQR